MVTRVAVGKKHAVTKGECLWALSHQYYGKGQSWPHIFEHNKRPEVMAATGYTIAHPDFIYVGQIVAIPDQAHFCPLVNVRTWRSRSRPREACIYADSRSDGKAKALDRVLPPPIVIDFPKGQIQRRETPLFIAEIVVTGSMIFQGTRVMNFAELKVDSVTLNQERQAAGKQLATLLTNVQVGFNPGEKTLRFETGLTLRSGGKYAPTVQANVGADAAGPYFKASLSAPPLKGHIGQYLYTSEKLFVDLTVRPKAPKQGKTPQSQEQAEERSSNPVAFQLEERQSKESFGWYIIKTLAAHGAVGVLLQVYATIPDGRPSFSKRAREVSFSIAAASLALGTAAARAVALRFGAITIMLDTKPPNLDDYSA